MLLRVYLSRANEFPHALSVENREDVREIGIVAPHCITHRFKY